MSVTARIEELVIPTYPVGAPEKNPVFFEKRVYQGSTGKVDPGPFLDKVHDEPVDTAYRSALLENEFVRMVMLPEIGGRIFTGQDRSNGDYDFIYRQDVIKPALVGLAGPWISGGIEFNWPQHHRPGTFLPADVHIEEEPDGARTVWLSEHDPILRLKGMHGIRLRPGSSLIELRGRLFNRTPFTQTFLWWANLAAMVHDRYQSFFPPDVSYVADHAVRAMSSFPEARNHYYGVDYASRPGANDLSWYRNIPVPTSYMVCQTKFDFFGGYDFAAGGGFVHVADRHIAPGKKQWTWGNHPFGWAWDRELTDANGPYIELMAGVFTDNQPDFSYLAPFETKTFSQYWWPIRDIGPVQQASRRAALRMVVREDRVIEAGLCASERIEGARLTISQGDTTLLAETVTIAPDQPWKNESARFGGEHPCELLAVLTDAKGIVLLTYRPVDQSKLVRSRATATEPPAPEKTLSQDELYFTGEHLELYRHPTRDPEPYWEEALRRDPGDARCNLAMGRRLLARGLFADAARHLGTAISRLTFRHPNPETGEAHYFLGLVHFLEGRHAPAYDLLNKATWNHAWRQAAQYLLACIDCREKNFDEAQRRLDEAIALNADHSKALVLSAAIARRRGDAVRARDILSTVLAKDPLDHWARREAALAGMIDTDGFFEGCRNDAQTILDLAFDYADAGLREEAAALVEEHLGRPTAPCAVPNPMARSAMSLYALAWLRRDRQVLAEARKQSPDRFFPSRLHEQIVLEWALAEPGADPVAGYALGNLLYDRRRHGEAIDAWRTAVADGAAFATVFRNLAIAVWNTSHDGDEALALYQKALALDPADPRLVSETDQLRAKRNDPLRERLAFLESRRDLVLMRDDCTIALATLHNLLGDPQQALAIVTSRRFHPWEGGEGAVLRQFTHAKIALGRKALADGDAQGALQHFSSAMETPESLGEAYHLLQAKADVNYWTGKALQALGRHEEAKGKFTESASESGDFAEMAVTAHSPLSYFRGLSLRELGKSDESQALFRNLKSFAEAKLGEKAKIDYFATSLPNLLVFDEDLQGRRDSENHLLLAMACRGLGEADEARKALDEARRFTNSDLRAAELDAEHAGC